MNIPEIFADFNNADMNGRVCLNTSGANENIQGMPIEFKEGMEVLLDDQDGLSAIGLLKRANNARFTGWVAILCKTLNTCIFPIKYEAAFIPSFIVHRTIITCTKSDR